jgi:peptidoglycan/LPS O-acetylase OafA/YrhL
MGTALLIFLLWITSLVGANYYSTWPLAVFWVFGIALAYFLMIGGVMGKPNWLLSIFRYPLLTYIGKIGYSIFIWHLVVIKQMANLPIPLWLKLLFSVVITGIISILSFHLIEQYFNKPSRLITPDLNKK